MIGCTEEPAPIAVASVTLDSSSMTLVEGESQKLTATVSPSNAENKEVIWTSSNSSVASVKDGLVTAIKVGEATITVKTDDGGKTAACKVTVNAKVYPVESVSLDRTSVELTEGDEITLNATVKPDNATNKNVTWSSSDESVIKVIDGKVTALIPGSAVITVKTEDGSKTATCEVTVKAKVYPVESVSLDRTSVELTEGDEITLNATVKPDNATNKNVTWSSSDESVVKVIDGKVTALVPGNAVITVKTEDGSKTATCEVTVNAKVYPVESVSLDRTSVELTEGDEITLNATVKPDNATNKNVTWSSSYTAVAQVVNGKVTALKAGHAVITVKTEDGSKTATCEVTVKAKVYPVESVSLDRTSAELTEGEEITLNATVKPDNATNKNVIWSSSNASVAKVVNGKVTALKEGYAIIIVSTEDGGKTATCEVTVKAKTYPVESVSLDRTSVELTEGDEIILNATVKPDNATNKNVTWSSSNSSVAKVVNGKVTALKEGYATIIVSTIDGGKTATCEVTVKAKVYPVEKIVLDKTYVEIKAGNEITITATIYPSNATNKTLKWTSSDTTIATVSDGKVRTLKAGHAVIKATSEEYGISATCDIKVLADGPGGSNESIDENEGIW